MTLRTTIRHWTKNNESLWEIHTLHTTMNQTKNQRNDKNIWDKNDSLRNNSELGGERYERLKEDGMSRKTKLKLSRHLEKNICMTR